MGRKFKSFPYIFTYSEIFTKEFDFMILDEMAEFYCTPEEYRTLKNLADMHKELDEKVKKRNEMIEQRIKESINKKELEKKLKKEVDKIIIKTLDDIFK